MMPAQAFPPDDENERRRAELQDSLARFLEENYSKILSFLLRQCFDPHLAQDALHEALIVTMDKWEAVSACDKPLYWVRRTAWHKLLSLHERQNGRSLVPLEPDEVAEPTSAYEAEMVLRYTLSQLPFRQRAVLALMVEGDTDEQIAMQLGLAVTTVCTYKSEVRRKYRELFRSGADEGTPA
ncbi:RNA polymerase sigma factor [Jidongwangia harbinensis]|uniref:RNA polymerase sigma factor n=1 Tax=Jidongwangia harbinensis TaxID=2878561 RepID=UPI001CD925A2|nr:LuxR C-terminal-related transcriptional regulator [Jidongwangia harbinensis]MCA2218435.1 LuxR C-terminal-related transcriptional regulator [Jidongwangia harbinensis]